MPAPPGLHPFDTALTMNATKEPPPHTPHGHSATRFVGPFAPEWCNLAGTAHGGILLAQALKAAEKHLLRTLPAASSSSEGQAQPPAIISLMGTYTSPILPSLGDVVYDTTTLRTSKRFAWVDSKIGQTYKGHMRHGTALTCTFALPGPEFEASDPLNPANLPEETVSSLKPPSKDEVPDPDACIENTETMRMAGFIRSQPFHHHREMRISPKLAERVKAIVSGEDSDVSKRIDVSTVAWCRFTEERPQDALSACFFSDALIPLNLSLALSTKGSKSYNPEVFFSWSTVGLTANFFGKPLKQMSGADGNGHWLLMKGDVQHISEGRAELEFVLWDIDLSNTTSKERKGRVVAVCRQQGVVVTRKREVA